MAIRRETVTLPATTGGAGTGTSTVKTSQVVHGRVKAIYLNYDGAAPATTDWVIAEAGQSPAIPILSVPNATASGWFFPVQPSTNAATGAATTNGTIDVNCADHVSFTILQANAAQNFSATIVWDDLRSTL